MSDDNRPQLIAPESVAHDVIADLDHVLQRAEEELFRECRRSTISARRYIKMARRHCDRLLIRSKTDDPETKEFLEEFSINLENTNE